MNPPNSTLLEKRFGGVSPEPRTGPEFWSQAYTVSRLITRSASAPVIFLNALILLDSGFEAIFKTNNGGGSAQQIKVIKAHNDSPFHPI